MHTVQTSAKKLVKAVGEGCLETTTEPRELLSIFSSKSWLLVLLSSGDWKNKSRELEKNSSQVPTGQPFRRCFSLSLWLGYCSPSIAGSMLPAPQTLLSWSPALPQYRATYRTWGPLEKLHYWQALPLVQFFGRDKRVDFKVEVEEQRKTKGQ